MSDKKTDVGLDIISGKNNMLSSVGVNLPDNLTYQEWEDIGKRLKNVVDGYKWWVGDWLNFGEFKYGEKYSQGMTLTGLPYETLLNLKYVSSKVQMSLRNDNLSWTHHKLIAPLSPDKQKYWLDRAEAEKMSTRQLRENLEAEGLINTQPSKIPEVSDNEDVISQQTQEPVSKGIVDSNQHMESSVEDSGTQFNLNQIGSGTKQKIDDMLCEECLPNRDGMINLIGSALK